MALFQNHFKNDYFVIQTLNIVNINKIHKFDSIRFDNIIQIYNIYFTIKDLIL